MHPKVRVHEEPFRGQSRACWIKRRLEMSGYHYRWVRFVYYEDCIGIGRRLRA